MILVTVDPFGDNPSLACPTSGFTMRFSVPWEIGGNEGLSITGASGCVFSGVEASSTGDRVFKLQAPGTTIRDFDITDCDKVAVRIYDYAPNSTLENLHIHCNFDGGNHDAAILIQGADGTRIVGNVISHHEDGIQLNTGSNDTVIDHNTFVGASTRGVYTVGGVTNLCMRNNIFSDVTSAVSLSSSTSWDATCAADLDDATWNNAVDNVTNLCASGSCDWTSPNCPGSTDCLPADEQLFFEFSGDYEVDPGFDIHENYCISSPNLIDQAADLGYDRNGDDGGNFNGAGPEVGGRETDSGVCR